MGRTGAAGRITHTLELRYSIQIIRILHKGSCEPGGYQARDRISSPLLISPIND